MVQGADGFRGAREGLVLRVNQYHGDKGHNGSHCSPPPQLVLEGDLEGVAYLGLRLRDTHVEGIWWDGGGGCLILKQNGPHLGAVAMGQDKPEAPISESQDAGGDALSGRDLLLPMRRPLRGRNDVPTYSHDRELRQITRSPILRSQVIITLSHLSSPREPGLPVSVIPREEPFISTTRGGGDCLRLQKG